MKALLKAGKSRDALLDELHLRVLGRKPGDAERAELTNFFTDPKTDEQVLNDLFWALLNAKEFAFNH